MVLPECALRPARRVPRRPVLLGLTSAMAGALTGCGGPGEPDPLVALAARARADAVLIDSLLADPSAATLAGRLAPLADARRVHAETLVVELGASAAPSVAPPSPSASTGRDAQTALAGVRAALDDAYRQSTALVPTLPRARAALVGSIAACCAAYRAVLQ